MGIGKERLGARGMESSNREARMIEREKHFSHWKFAGLERKRERSVVT